MQPRTGTTTTRHSRIHAWLAVVVLSALGGFTLAQAGMDSPSPTMSLGGAGSCTDSSGCDDRNPCTDDICDPETHQCVSRTNTNPCSDGNACTTGDTCRDGGCQAGSSVTCADGNVCTDDACDPSIGCVFPPNMNACDDGSSCTLQDTCRQGVCRPGMLPNCDDANPCTDDGCNPATGCVHTNNTAPCNDGNACTTDEICQGGLCRGEGLRNCADENPCTDDACDPSSGCVFTPNTNPCDDGNLCTDGDVCNGGACVGGQAPSCDDGNRCTNDTCNAATGCTHTNNTVPCDDGNACTTADACSMGECHGGSATSCDDRNACTDDACNPASGCIHTNNTVLCDDGSLCTTGDVCRNGSCVPGTPVVCGDNNPCTDDVCDPAAGCVFPPHEGPCDDGSVCTLQDTCRGGVCRPGALLNCDDGNPCTDDSCNGSTGCVHADNSAPCEDGFCCTADDACRAGVCVGGPLLPTDDGNPCTDDSCDPVICVVVHRPNSHPCDDGNACTRTDVCTNGACSPGSPIVCGDGNPCTANFCDPATGCRFTPVEGPCNDSNACTTQDMCVNGQCTGSVALDCDDNNECTLDRCDPGMGCIHTDDPDCGSIDLCAISGNTTTVAGSLRSSVDEAGDVTAIFTISPDINDNCYGVNAVDWPRSHAFLDLVEHEAARFVFKDGQGHVVLDFTLDYLSQSLGTPSGYSSLGAAGGDGRVKRGENGWILDWKTSLESNLNDTGYCASGHCLVSSVDLLVSSPPTISPDPSYNVPPAFSRWIFPITYLVKVSHFAFGFAGFGGVDIPSMKNDPAKTGKSDEKLTVCECSQCDDGDPCTIDSCRHDGHGPDDHGEHGTPDARGDNHVDGSGHGHDDHGDHGDHGVGRHAPQGVHCVHAPDPACGS